MSPKIYESGRSNVSVSNYVLVKFAGEKIFIYYDGQIKVKNTESEFSVKCLRNKANSSNSYFPVGISRLIAVYFRCMLYPSTAYTLWWYW